MIFNYVLDVTCRPKTILVYKLRCTSNSPDANCQKVPKLWSLICLPGFPYRQIWYHHVVGTWGQLFMVGASQNRIGNR